mmetsp:Transcript_88377/g.189806  ORF Transcript_88377/g.189806 Transcript_88377/m.189806 type:complete len:90 (-) Transcript_88377:513-782(-)
MQPMCEATHEEPSFEQHRFPAKTSGADLRTRVCFAAHIAGHPSTAQKPVAGTGTLTGEGDGSEAPGVDVDLGLEEGRVVVVENRGHPMP